MNQSTDLDRINEIVGAAAGVREAAAVMDRRLRAGAAPAPEAAAPPLSGTAFPGDRESLVVGPEPRLPPDAVRTVPEALLAAAESAPGRGTTYVLPDGSTDRQTYPELLEEASRALTGLRGLGLREGDPVLLQCADNRTFVTAFWACALGGYVPTPVGPAPDYRTDNAVVRKLRAAWDLLERPLLLTDAGLRDQVAGLGKQWGAGAEFRVASVDEITAETPAEPFPAEPDHPFVNLMTSGSTGTPKCVHHTHRSLVARTYAAIAANGFTEDEVSLNWMPLDHVGGMVMFNVRDTFLRCEHVNARTESMIRRPLNWLDWAERFRATATWAPNFAFALVNRYAEEIGQGNWDLSSMRNICNAGEAVVARTAFRFLELLTPHGLPPDAMLPCWGMSETSSGVLYSRLDVRDPRIGTLSIDPASLDGQLVEVAHGAPGALTMVEVGVPVAGFSLRIVDGDGRIVPEGRIGHLQVAGDTIMREYLRNKEAAAAFVGGGWFDTGDLGFVRDGRLTLTGRRKHMVIVNGANHPAHEVEAVVEQVPGVRPACSAVCGVHDEETGTDAVLVFFVPTEEAAGDLDATVADVRAALTREFSLRSRSIVPVTEEEFPRMAGGKVQRERLLEAQREGRFDDRSYAGGAARAAEDGHPLLEALWLPAASAEEAPGDPATVVYAPSSARWPRLLDNVTGLITPGGGFTAGEGDHVGIDALDPDHHDRALAHLVSRSGPPQRVVYALETGPEDSAAEAPVRFLTALAAIARAVPDAELVVLTQGAVGARPTDRVVPGRTALTAMVRTAVAEATLPSVRMLDAPDDADDEQFAALTRARYGADVAAVRDGAGHTAQLRVVERTEDFGVPGEFLEPGGTVLLTGGLGGLGRSVAEHLLVAAGARLLIVGRTPEDRLGETGADEVLAGLRGLGEVRYAQADVADRGALAAAVADAEREWQSGLDLVVHLAGAPIAPQWDNLSEYGLVSETASWLRRMLRPKLGGCEAIDALLEQRPGAAVVLFSSVNGFLGGSGFGSYAAANAALDGYAHRWSAEGRPVRCLSWSMWSGPGMNEGNPLVAAALHRGLRLIDPAEGLSLLLESLHQPSPLLVLGADVDNPQIKAHLAPDQFSGGSTVVAVVPEEGAHTEAVWREVSAALSQAGVLAQITMLQRLPRDGSGRVDPVAVIASREDAYSVGPGPQGDGESQVARGVCRVLELEPDQVGRNSSFFSLGFDSIRAVQLAEDLGARFHRDVAVGLLYEHPTVRELAEAIEQG